MKLVTRILSLLILAGFAAFYSSCNKDDGNNKSEEEKQFDKLKASWTLVSANLDGAPRTDNFQNLVLTLSGTFAKGGTFTYSFTGTRPNPSPWPGSGQWKFGTNVTEDIIRDPGVASETNMKYTVTDTGLIFNFTVSGDGWQGGRVRSVSGAWTFEFAKQ